MNNWDKLKHLQQRAAERSKHYCNRHLITNDQKDQYNFWRYSELSFWLTGRMFNLIKL